MPRTPAKRPAQQQSAQRASASKRRRTIQPDEAVLEAEEAERTRELLRNGRVENDEEEDEDEDMLDGKDDGDEDDDDADGADQDVDTDAVSPSKAKGKGTARKKRVSEPTTFLPKTSADAYFLAHSAKHAPKPTPPSQKSFSSLSSISANDVTAVLSRPHIVGKHAAERERLHALHRKRFDQFAFELSQGFNVLCYGWGSKRTILDEFARKVCAKRGHVAILHGYLPSTSYVTVLSSLFSLPFAPAHPPSPSHPLAPEELYHALSASPRPLYMVIHSLDAVSFLNPHLRSLLSLLALHPNCHVIATLEKINAPILFTHRELSMRKHPALDYDASSDSPPSIPPQRGFAVLWHDLTTFQSYAAELAPRSASFLSTSGSGPGGAGAHLDATATAHILNSVTDKSRNLFVILGKLQLEAMTVPAGDSANESALPQGAPKHATAFAALLTQAREAFIATNDTSFRHLLGEFRDHGLVGVAGAGAQEVLWVNVNKASLQNVLRGLEDR